MSHVSCYTLAASLTSRERQTEISILLPQFMWIALLLWMMMLESASGYRTVIIGAGTALYPHPPPLEINQ